MRQVEKGHEGNSSSHSLFILEETCGGQVLGKIRGMVVTHVPTEHLPKGIIYWRILPTNSGSRSYIPRLKRRTDPCWLARAHSFSSPRYHVEGSLLALNIRKKTAAPGSGSKLPLHLGLFRLYDSRGSINMLKIYVTGWFRLNAQNCVPD